MKNGRYTPKKEKGWREAMKEAIDDGTVEATEIQALWCKDERELLDVQMDPDGSSSHMETCTGPHRVLFVFEPVV